MFGLGTPELLVIGLIAVFVFGAKKLPSLGQNLGQAIASFKKETRSLQEESKKLVQEVPGVSEAQELTSALQQVQDIGKIIKK